MFLHACCEQHHGFGITEELIGKEFRRGQDKGACSQLVSVAMHETRVSLNDCSGDLRRGTLHQMSLAELVPER
jgi:hypothetical protein